MNWLARFWRWLGDAVEASHRGQDDYLDPAENLEVFEDRDR